MVKSPRGAVSLISVWCLLLGCVRSSDSTSFSAPLYESDLQGSQVQRSRAGADHVVPGCHIVQLKPTGLLGSGLLHKRSHHLYKRHLLDFPSVQILQSWENTPDIFHGRAIQFDESSATLRRIDLLHRVVNHEMVKTVWSCRRYTQSTWRQERWDGAGLDSNQGAVMYQIGADKVHEMGYRGKGFLSKCSRDEGSSLGTTMLTSVSRPVAILDTAVDYRLPALGGGFGPGYKIVKGYDFVGDAYNPDENSPIPDDDPYGGNVTCAAHGTAVAGLVGAVSETPKFVGVAPEANLAIYRIFGCSPAALGAEAASSEPVIISAMLRAAKEGADVINVSIASPRGWSEAPTSVVVENIVKSGIAVVIAAGNGGETGVFYSQAPGSSLKGISVGSVNASSQPSYEGTIIDATGAVSTYIYYTPKAPNFTDLPLRLLDNSSLNVKGPAGACNKTFMETGHLSNTLVLVARGECICIDKWRNLVKRGARHVLLVSDHDDITQLDEHSVLEGLDSVSIITKTEGVRLLALAKSGQLRMSEVNTTVHDSSTTGGGKVSKFSSYGPNFELDNMSPALVAPGNPLLSTWPLDENGEGGYGVIGGTSYSSAIVAGSLVLLSEANNRRASFDELLARLVATSTPVDTDRSTELDTVVHQGAGLMNIHRAILESFVISPPFLLLNDTRFSATNYTIRIRNQSPLSATLAVKHRPAGTVMSFLSNGSHPQWPVDLFPQHASVDFDRTTLTVPALGEAELNIAFTPPSGVNASLAPIYSGFIMIGNLTLPYYGLASRLYDLPIIDTRNFVNGVHAPFLLDSKDNVVNSSVTTLDLSDPKSSVSVYYRLLTGARSIFFELVSNEGHHPESLGTIDRYEYLARSQEIDQNYWSVAFNGTYFSVLTGERTKAQKGDYRIQMRVLKVTGDFQKGSDYEYWLSPTIKAA